MLHLPAQPDAPIACDMRGAVDTPAERLQASADLFEHALLARDRRPGGVVFRVRGDARAAVEELARREAACCPFLDYRVEPHTDEVVWTISGGPAGEETLDAFHALSEGRITLPE